MVAKTYLCSRKLPENANDRLNDVSWGGDNPEENLKPLVLVLAPLQLSHERGNDDIRHELGLVIDLNLSIDSAHSNSIVT